MQYLTFLLPLAALAAANPLERRGCAENECLAAVTGKAALGDGKLRASHCASFLATTVTPVPVTVTTTVVGESTAWEAWKRNVVAVCPNEVPNYASACDEKAYSSACSCFGFTEVKTTTVAPSTTTKTVYAAPTKCDGEATVTVTKGKETVTVTSAKETVTKGEETVTVTKAKETVTVTTAKETITKGTETVTETATETETVTKDAECADPTDDPDVPDIPDLPSGCLTDEDANTIVDNFKTLLEFTSYNGTQGRPGRGYKQDVSDATLATDFVDISDSINFMAGFPLGSVTFASKAAFDIGQGVNQPEVKAETLNVWHGCRDITWRWKVTPATAAPFPVNGINYMIINKDGKISKQYAEFDNGAWLQSFPGSTCAIRPVTVASETALKARHFGA